MRCCLNHKLAIAATTAWLCSPSPSALAIPQNRFPLAFAAGGGFGGGSFGGSKSATKGKKQKAKKFKKSSLLSEVQVAALPLKQPSAVQNTAEGPLLDKWGLPIPTTDDIFPPMPPGTELISVDTTKEDFTVEEIIGALKDYIELSNLQTRFDEKGVEENPLPGRDAMKLRILHQSPPVLAVENFFTKEDCEQVKKIALSSEEPGCPVQVQSATFSALAQSKRTSTSWFCYYSQVPTLLAKAHHILGIPTLVCEEPQIVRYSIGQEFSWHYDEVPAPQLKNGGQRLATLLVYLNDVSEEAGGGTVFRDLKDGATGDMLTMKPKEGSALLFFPAFRDGRPDDRTLHKGEVAGEEKWIIQMWIHEKRYVAQIPEGNFQESAKEHVDRISGELGYLNK